MYTTHEDLVQKQPGITRWDSQGAEEAGVGARRKINTFDFMSIELTIKVKCEPFHCTGR